VFYLEVKGIHRHMDTGRILWVDLNTGVLPCGAMTVLVVHETPREPHGGILRLAAQSTNDIDTAELIVTRDWGDTRVVEVGVNSLVTMDLDPAESDWVEVV
jgi:hypothetical protein